MPIPNLSSFGLLPPGRHTCSLSEAEATFVHTSQRVRLWQGFLAFLAWAEEGPRPTCVLVDGSFTGDKDAPSDIDVVFDLEGCSTDVVQHWCHAFMTMREFVKATFLVDFWIYMPGTTNDLRAFFEYVRPEEAIVRGMDIADRKGLLRIALC